LKVVTQCSNSRKRMQVQPFLALTTQVKALTNASPFASKSIVQHKAGIAPRF